MLLFSNINLKSLLFKINRVLGDDLMIVESIIGLGVIGAVVYLFWKNLQNDASVTDVNKDGKTDIKDVAVAVEKVADVVEDAVEKAVEKAVYVVDVNDDGKVDKNDAEAVLESVKKNVKAKIEKTEPTKPKRARTKKGQFKPDDKATEETNEAWEGGKAPEKKPKKPKKPKMTVVK